MTWAARCAGAEARPITGATSDCKWATLSERAAHLCFVACEHVVDNWNGGPHAPQNFHAYTWCKPHSCFQVSDYSSCKQGSNFITIVNTPSPFPPVCPPGKVVRRPAWVNSSGAYWTSQSVSEFEVSWSATLSGQLVKSDKRLESRAPVHVQKPNAGPNWPLLSDQSAESLEEVEGARRKLELAVVSLSCPPCAPRAAALARCFASAICFSTRAFTLNSSSGLFGDGLKPPFRGESFEAFVDSSKRTRSLRR